MGSWRWPSANKNDRACSQAVIQNAEDIAQESDRQRSRKIHLRNSWSAEVSESAHRHVSEGRPLSTGHLLTPVSVCALKRAGNNAWLDGAPGQVCVSTSVARW